MYEILNLYVASRQTDGGVDETRGCPRPARNPAGAGADPEIYPRVWPRAGFPLPHGFSHGRVFANPVPAPVGAIPIPGNSRVVAVMADGAVAGGGRDGGMIFTPKSLSASSVSTF